ncbi:MAG: spore germination protein [Clostridiales bacterium]|nr:spore germination protein [Clostridiales bacterium]MDK2902614.1 spore germination protein [Clostridiales bacterium]
MHLSTIYCKLKDFVLGNTSADTIPSADGSYNDIKLDKSLDKNIKTLQTIFKDCDDVVYRPFKIAGKIKAELIFLDGLTNVGFVDDYIIKPLMLESRMANVEIRDEDDAFSYAQDRIITTGNMRRTAQLDDVLFDIMTGDVVIFIDGVASCIVVETKGWEHRQVNEPTSEPTMRGPKDAFTETLRVNTMLIRRRVRDPKLKLRIYHIGRRSKTDVAVMYIDSMVNHDVLDELNKRLDAIDADNIVGSAFIEHLIEDNWMSPFPQIQTTERPDRVAAMLMDGKICIIVDNTPFVLLVPTTLNSLMETPDDYYQRWLVATLIRLTRFIGSFAALLLPSLYIAMLSYHPEMIPTSLALSMAAGREGLPFPAFVEAFIMESSLELLREAGMRLPGAMGQTIGVVGAIIIGQAAVSANVVSPAMVMVVAFTAISNFAIPSYDLAISFRILRFILMLSAATLGLYGVILVVMLIISHLSVLKSFGIPYMAPWIPLNLRDLKDTIIRVPWLFMRTRESYMHTQDERRMNTDKINDVRRERGNAEH